MLGNPDARGMRTSALDYDLWIGSPENLPLRFVPYDLALYRLHPASKTVAAPADFIEGVQRILCGAAQRGKISNAQAKSRGDVFAMRTYLMPNTLDLSQGRRYAWSALRAEPGVWPQVLLILVKASFRLLLGEPLWSMARLAKAKLG